MSSQCAVCNKRPHVGNKVSHSLRHTKRRFLPNLQSVRMDDGMGGTIRVEVCTRCLKAGKVRRAR